VDGDAGRGAAGVDERLLILRRGSLACGMHFGRDDMKGMDIMATRSVVPLGAELANGLHAPSVEGDGQGMSFAKSFGEVAVGAEAIVGAPLVGQMLKGKAAPLAKGIDAPAGSMDTLPKASADEALKGAETLPKTTVALSVAGAVQSMPAKAPEKPANAVPFVVDEKAGPQVGSLRGEGIDVSGHATSGAIEKLVEPTEDAAGEKEAAGTKIDSMEHPSASKVVQPLLVSDGERSGIQKKEAVTTATSGVEKTAKKEVKAKDHSSTAAVDPKNSLGLPEGVGVQVAISVPTSGVVPVVAKAQAIDGTAEDDSRAGATQGSVVGIVGARAAKSSPYGTDRAATGTSASDVSKDEKTVFATKADDGFAPKDEAVSSKATGNVASANKWIEEKTHNSGGVIAVSGAHGVLAVAGNVAGDAVAGKVRANTTGVAMTTGQEGSDPGTESVGDGHRTLEATPTALEVGVANGTHGWLKIRAEMADGGVVNASVSATTSAGQEMLHRELPSLTAYLQEERIGVGSVVLHATAAAGPREFAGGMESDAGREQMQQRGGQEGESRQDALGTSFSDGGDGYFQGGLSGTEEMDEIAARAGYAGGGSWLSVRA
jgi:hypothetical protein